MRMGLIAAALLLGLTVSLSRADYVIIVVNVGEKKDNTGGGARGQAGAIGAVGVAGAAGAAGAIGAPGAAGAVGVAGAAGAAGAIGAPGAAGAVGAVGAAGAAGAIGKPPMAQAGAAGAVGAIGNPPMAQAGGGGALGGIPVGQAGAMGAVGGVPDIGFAGQQGALGGGGDTTKPEKEAKIRAMAVFEYTPVQYGRDQNKKVFAYIRHNWGESWIWAHDVELDILKQKNGRALPAVGKRFEEERRKIISRGKPSAVEWLDLAQRALSWGLLKEFQDTMKELEATDKTHPAVVAFGKVSAALKQKIGKTTAAQEWLEKRPFQGFKMDAGDFHVLLHKAPQKSLIVTSRLDHLRDNFLGFYYWHALKGKVLPMPQDKLVTVLSPGDVTDFMKQNEIFDGVPITSDSFYSPRHNLIVFAGRRLDVPYQGVVRSVEALWKTFNREDILKRGARRPSGTNALEMAHAQTYALLLKGLDEDGERASVSHSGTRQILVGAGLVPGNVDLPKWMQFGMGSFLQTPPGSPWKSYGAPHWSYLLSFNDLKKDRKIEPADKLIRGILSDSYFETGKKTQPIKARATAWAFTFFLMQKRLDGMERLYKELSRLPRDLPMDGEVLLDAFCRALGCVDGSNKRDNEKLTQLGEAFLSYMNDEVKLDNEAQPMLEAIYKLQNDLVLEMKDSRPSIPGLPGGFPGFPGFPGGLPGLPGGGGGAPPIRPGN